MSSSRILNPRAAEACSKAFFISWELHVGLDFLRVSGLIRNFRPRQWFSPSRFCPCSNRVQDRYLLTPTWLRAPHPSSSSTAGAPSSTDFRSLRKVSVPSVSRLRVTTVTDFHKCRHPHAACIQGLRVAALGETKPLQSTYCHQKRLLVPAAASRQSESAACLWSVRPACAPEGVPARRSCNRSTLPGITFAEFVMLACRPRSEVCVGKVPERAARVCQCEGFGTTTYHDKLHQKRVNPRTNCCASGRREPMCGFPGDAT